MDFVMCICRKGDEGHFLQLSPFEVVCIIHEASSRFKFNLLEWSSLPYEIQTDKNESGESGFPYLHPDEWGGRKG